MPRSILLCLVVCLGAVGPVQAQGRKGPDRQAERLRALQIEFRALESKVPGVGPPKADQLRILQEAVRLKTPAAVAWLVDIARDDRCLQVQADLLRLLVEEAGESVLVATLLQEHMASDDPSRDLARTYLLDRSIRHRDEAWIGALFARGSTEERFLALDAMGRIGSKATLESARELLADPAWQPVPGTCVHCGTIALSLRAAEGPEAARLLLLLQKDPRFSPSSDPQAIREATRLWSRIELRQYIDINGLSHPEAERRIETARFLGMAGVEAARAPLLHVASNPREEAPVRAAAAEALGRLTVARGDLAGRLAPLLDDPQEAVARGAIEGLGHLGVAQAAEVLVARVDGPLGAAVRATLARMSARPPQTDWKAWFARACELPEGT